MVAITRKSQLTEAGKRSTAQQQTIEDYKKKGYTTKTIDGRTYYEAPTVSYREDKHTTRSYVPHRVVYEGSKKVREEYYGVGGTNKRKYATKTIDYKSGEVQEFGAYGKATVKMTKRYNIHTGQVRMDRASSLRRLDKEGYVDPDTKRWVAKGSERDKDIQKAKHLTPTAQVKEYGRVIVGSSSRLKQEAEARGMSTQQVKKFYSLTPEARVKEYGVKSIGGTNQAKMSAYQREKGLEDKYGKGYTFTEDQRAVTRLSPEVSKKFAEAIAKEQAKEYASKVDKSKQGKTDIYYKPPEELGGKTKFTYRVRPKDQEQITPEGWKLQETKSKGWWTKKQRDFGRKIGSNIKKGYLKTEDFLSSNIGVGVGGKFYSIKQIPDWYEKKEKEYYKHMSKGGIDKQKLSTTEGKRLFKGETITTGGKKSWLDLPAGKTTARVLLPRFTKGYKGIAEDYGKIKEYNITAPQERKWDIMPVRSFEDYKAKGFHAGVARGFVGEFKKPLKNIALLTVVPYGARQTGKLIGAGAMKGFVKGSKYVPLTISKGVGYTGIGVAKATTPTLLGGYGYMKYRQMKGKPFGVRGEITGRTATELSLLMGGSLLSYRVPPQMKFGERAFETQRLQAQTVMGYKGTPATVRLHKISKEVGKGMKQVYRQDQPFRREYPFKNIFGRHAQSTRLKIAKGKPIYQGSGVQYRYSKNLGKWLEVDGHGKLRVIKDADVFVRNPARFEKFTKLDAHPYYERSAFPFARSKTKVDIFKIKGGLVEKPHTFLGRFKTGYKGTEGYIRFGEQITRKGSGMFTIRTGKTTGQPELYRFGKDYNDFIEGMQTGGHTKTAKTLTNIEKTTPTNIYYSKPTQFFSKIGLVKQSPEIKLPFDSMKPLQSSGYKASYLQPTPPLLLKPNSKKRVVVRSPSPSPSVSISASLIPYSSPSPSRSTSPSRSPSPSMSPSRSLSPSPSPSMSLSPSPSPSVSPSPSASPSPSVSPSPSPSPSPSVSFSPSPSPSPSVSFSPSPNQPPQYIIMPPFWLPKKMKIPQTSFKLPKFKSPTKYRPTLHASIGGITAPKPKSKKKLKLTGLEQRPIYMG